MQFKIMDFGFTLGTNVNVFRQKWMMNLNAAASFGMNAYPKWVANPKKKEEFSKLIESKSIRVLKEECLDLPPLIRQKVYLSMGVDQDKTYRMMRRDLIVKIKEQEDAGLPLNAIAANAMVLSLKLLQIASGFVYGDDGRIHEWGDCPKLEYLKTHLPTLVAKHKVIIWCCFTPNITKIGQLCTIRGVKAVALHGRMTSAQKRDAIAEFQEVDDCRVIIANRAAGGIGVNLTESAYSIVFSRNYSLNDELQSEARNHRKGSEKHESIIKLDLMVENTIEAKVVEALTRKEKLATSILDIVRED